MTNENIKINTNKLTDDELDTIMNIISKQNKNFADFTLNSISVNLDVEKIKSKHK